MSLNKIEIENLKRDLQTMTSSVSLNTASIEALKLIELRRINSNLEYLGSIMGNAPWNIKDE